MKSLDAKLANIHGDPSGASDFILADAKDADMAFGLAATGVDAVTGTRRSLADFRDQVREIVRQGLVDIMLMSVSTSEQLTFDERLFDASPITPAVRANDTTDIHALAEAVSDGDDRADQGCGARRPRPLLDHPRERRRTRRRRARGLQGLSARR